MNTINSKLYLGVMLVFLTMLSCHKQEYYNENPNQPSTGTPALLLTKVLIDGFNTYPLDAAYAARYLTYYERPNAYINYGWTQGSYDEYNILRNVKNMEELANVSNEKNYLGIAKFMRAVLFSRLTERFGDIPFSQALKASEGIDKPIYDKQEDVYAGILKDLEDAQNLLDPSYGSIGGDIIFKGDILKWKKAVSVLSLRTLIHLSKKEGNSKIPIKSTFATIIANPVKYPLMKDINDNAQIVYNKSDINNYYPTFNNLSVQSLVSIEQGFANMMIERQDLRLFSIADPIQGKAANVFANYAGVNAGLIISDQQNKAPDASKINRRFVNNEVNEPRIMIGFAEQEFIIAEAIQRGWISGPGTASSHYITGIRASFQFYNIGALSIENYIGRPAVRYDAAIGLNQIAEQKYLAMFCQSDFEPFYEQRRTGIPKFNVGAATLNDSKIPKRWAYPQSEYFTNTDAVNAALSAQSFSIDDINQTMWIVK